MLNGKKGRRLSARGSRGPVIRMIRMTLPVNGVKHDHFSVNG